MVREVGVHRRVILALVCTLAVLMSVAVYGAVDGASAFFTDTETSRGNRVQAASLDLLVDGDNENTVKFTVADFSPEDSTRGTWELCNQGTIQGYLDLESVTVTGYENKCIDPETSAGDTTCGDPGEGKGELESLVNLKIFWDEDCNGSGDPGDQVIYSGVAGEIPSHFEEDKQLQSGACRCVTAEFYWPPGPNDDIAQTDSLELGVNFQLAQTAGQ